MVLTAREYTLFAHLMAEPRRVFTRDQLLGDLWGSSWRSDGIVTEYIRRLRRHLANHDLANCLVTRHGFGYSYNPDAPVTLG
jgi:DNA-binding response OmpR family regulator